MEGTGMEEGTSNPAITARVMTPAGFEYDMVLQTGNTIIVGWSGKSNEKPKFGLDDLGADDLDFIGALILELAYCDLTVLECSIRGIAMSHEWIEEVTSID